MKTIALAGTLDTKGKEFLFVKETLESLGVKVLTIHTGVFEPAFTPDISNAKLAEAAGETIASIVEKRDRAHATAVLSKGMEALLPELYEAGHFDGVLSFGGTGGTSLVTPGMRALPLGVPKIMVSTVASGNTEPYIGTSDLIMMPSVVDVSGLNEISTRIFTNACLAITGMVNFEEPKTEHIDKKPLIAATMFGLTTPAVNHAKAYLEARGFEVLVFHATGVGGRTMEKLISEGYIDGVLDLTTTEWADEIVGGVLAAGPYRLEAAGKRGIPQVVSLGAMDMVNFGPFDSVPSEFSGRNFYKHNPTVTLMRTTKEENEQIGYKIAEKLNMSQGKTAIVYPLKGLSGLDVEGQAFYGPEEDAVLFETVKKHLKSSAIEQIEVDADINDERVAEAAAQKLVDFMTSQKGAN
ncbi:Tm-1-like ATP-binding domain-containing protein [Lentibacillus saliphilus]|uniref:Tm-1-like ATP-binding domain-containing protein n=1 Tax=Lentibacillus saliphilus TaxID=2737028 RepID=UPI001C2FD5FB|nr:Tm-1-like ATP-binding domain-containing protein [Lentibacillus saliphilus]